MAENALSGYDNWLLLSDQFKTGMIDLAARDLLTSDLSEAVGRFSLKELVDSVDDINELNN